MTAVFSGTTASGGLTVELLGFRGHPMVSSKVVHI